MIGILVCVGSACHLKGSYNVINRLQQLIDEKGLGDAVEVKAALCLGKCTGGVSVQIEGEETLSLTPETLEGFFDENIIDRVRSVNRPKP